MKSQNPHKKEQQAKAIELYKGGYSNKEIANVLGVTEKTIGVWLKPVKQQKAGKEKAMSKMIDRINEILEAKEPDFIAKVKDLTYSLTMLKSL